MTDIEFAKLFGNLYIEVMSKRKDEDYEINKPQMDKFMEVLDFFKTAAQKNKGKIETVEIQPKFEHGGIVAKFTIFGICGEEIQQFCKVISYTSAFGIDELKDGFSISVTVPNIFIEKEK